MFPIFFGRRCLELHFDALMMIGNYINYINYMDKTVPIEKKNVSALHHCYAGGIPGGISAPLSLGGTDWL